MRDRTGDFLSTTSRNNGESMELTSIRTSSGHSLNDILACLDSVSKQISDLQSLIDQVEGKQRKAQRVFEQNNTDTLIETRQEIEAMNRDANSLALKIRNRLKEIQNIIKSELLPGSADYRMANTQYTAHATKMRDIIISYQRNQEEQQRRQRARFEREYKIVNPAATQYESEEIMNNKTDFSNEQVFANHILRSTYNEEAKSLLKDVKSRQHDLTQLAEQIEELATLFTDLDELVNMQNAQIESISQHIEGAKVYTEASNAEMTRAIKTAHSVRRRKWCLAVSCIILVAVLVVVIILVIVPAAQKSLNSGAQ
ncbi:hypothetical protein MP228_007587 [Amoeboaphelidium protococcarum]|nr:hypothetical protein MP228_007587 [Amoeboaphelidium protococcarum]